MRPWWESHPPNSGFADRRVATSPHGRCHSIIAQYFKWNTDDKNHPQWYTIIPYSILFLMRSRSWDDSSLKKAVTHSTSMRQVIYSLGLIPAGGNYVQIQRRIKELSLNTGHFTGQLWSKGKQINRKPLLSLESILIKGGTFQSHKLKQRLFKEGVKAKRCEMCGWAKVSKDGRIPLELDHVNGDRNDNRLENLRILCPNCHSMQPTHRGKNKQSRDGVIGSHVRLKIECREA